MLLPLGWLAFAALFGGRKSRQPPSPRATGQTACPVTVDGPDLKPPVTAELVWAEDLQFGVTSGKIATVVDGHSTAGASPVQCW